MKDDVNAAAQSSLPVWARDEAFPEAGDGYGWIDRKGKRHVCASSDELATAIREDKDSVMDLVWTPESAHCRVPEEVAGFEEPIKLVRKRWAEDDLADAQHRLKKFGLALAVLIGYMAFQAWRILNIRGTASGIELGPFAELRFIFLSVKHSNSVGLALLGFLIFAFIPWYQANKRMREMRKNGGKSVPVIPLIRFETWLDAQKAPFTRFILVIISAVFLAQIYFDRSILTFHETVNHAGLLKANYRAGEYWRLFTAPMLHGGVIHFVMNALALLYLGKRTEVFARWPHVATVFVFAALVGGEASARFYFDKISVGASGGLMGWLGFLLVFETLHSKLVPKSAKRRLVGGVVMTALIGAVGYSFIDNAAHFGGLLAGMAYAAIVFPKSASVLRPRITFTDKVIGSLSLLIILMSAAFAIVKMAA